MQKVLMEGGGTAETRIRMAPTESEWPISRWHPKAIPQRGPSPAPALLQQAKKEKKARIFLGRQPPHFHRSARDQQNVGECFPQLTKAKSFSPGLHIKEPDQNPPWPNSDLQVKFYPLPDKNQPKDFLGHETTETIGLASKWFWHEMKIVQASPPP